MPLEPAKRVHRHTLMPRQRRAPRNKLSMNREVMLQIVAFVPLTIGTRRVRSAAVLKASRSGSRLRCVKNNRRAYASQSCCG